jgi:two-component system OmpR family response regulator
LRLDVEGKRAWVDGAPLDLSAREWAALEFLAGRVNRIINKDQFMQALYSWEEEITPNAIEKFVSRLRGKLEPAGVNIRTVRGLGYYLEKPATQGDGAG